MRHVANADRMDIRAVLHHLSAQSEAERQVAGLSKEELLYHLFGLASEGHSEVATHDGRSIAVYGIVERGEFNNTWFIASERFFSMGVAGARYGRLRLKHFREEYGKPLRALSLSPLAEAPKWFRSFGFVDAGVVDGRRAFVYR